MSHFMGVSIFWIGLNPTDLGCWRLTLNRSLIPLRVLYLSTSHLWSGICLPARCNSMIITDGFNISVRLDSLISRIVSENPRFLRCRFCNAI